MALDESFIFDIDVQIVNEQSLTALRAELRKAREEYQQLRGQLRNTARAQLTEAAAAVNASRRKKTALETEIRTTREKVKLDRQAEISSGNFARTTPGEIRAINRRVTALRAQAQVQRRLNQEKVAEAQISRFRDIGREDLVTDSLRRQAGQRTLADVEREITAKKKQEEQFTRFRLQQEQKVAREKERLAKQAARENQRLTGNDAGSLIQRRDRAQRTVAELRRQGREDLITNSLRTQAGELKKQEGLAQRLLFTFRRLVGVLALFTLARVITREFINLVKFGVQFADTIKGSEIAIGGIITASTRLSDEFGNVVTGVEALNAAQGVARKELQALRQDALRTTATFEELVETFQIAVGPGLSAGGTLAEIRELTVGISQAATAIGLPQNQLAEEVRSILSGTIQARTTRIATTLGITNADIKQLKEAGTLFETLNERFEAFNESAEKQARTTISGIQALLRGAFGEVLAQASIGFRGILLDQLVELLDGVLLVKDELNNVSPNPAAVALFKTVFDFLGEILTRLKSAASQLTFTDVIRSLRFVQAILKNVIAFAEGFGTIVAASFQILVSLFSTFRDTLGASTQGALRFLGAVVAIRLTIPAIVSGFFSILGLSNKINKSMLIWTGLALAVGKAFEFVVEKVSGVDVSLTDTVKLIGLGLSSAINDVGGLFAKLGAVIKTTVIANLRLAEFAARRTIIAIQRAKALATGDDAGQQQGVSDLLALQLERENNARELRTSLTEKFATIDRETKFREIELGQRVSDILGDNKTQTEKAAEAMGGLNEELDKAKNAIEEAFGGGLALSSANEVLRDLATPLQELQENAIIADREFLKLASTIRTLEGTGGGAVLKIFDEGSLATAKKLEASQRALNDLQDQLQQEQGETADSRAKILSLEKDIKDVEDARLLVTQEQTRISRARAASEALRLADELRGTAELARLESQFALEDTLAPNNATRESVQAQKDLAIAIQTARQEDEKRAQSIALLETLSAGFTGRQKQAIEDLILLEQERKGVEEQAFRARIARLEEEARRAKILASDDFGAGVSVGFTKLVEELPTLAQTGAEFIKQTVTGLGEFISTTIVDAFDPTKDNTIRERFASFLQGLASLLLNQFAQLQIAKFFPSLFPGLGAAGGATGGQVAGGAFGGRVRGFDDGGIVPSNAPSVGSQPGFDPRDVVPALLRRNEFVVRPEVAKPNMAFLHALNSGQFLPHLLRSGMKTKGFASGGPTSGSLPSVPSASSAAPGTTVLPVVPADEQTMDRLANGGSASMKQYISDNAPEVRALLGI